MEGKTVSGKKSFAGASHGFNLHRVLKLALIECLDLANRIHGGKCARERIVQGVAEVGEKEMWSPR